MKQITTIAATMGVLLTLAAPALAVGSPDEAFMVKAAQGGMAEVKAGQIALANGGANSKKFGAMMVKDHSKANMELMALAKKLAVKLPAAPNVEQQAMGKKLMGLKGAAFDAAYLPAMKKGHVDTIALFESEAASGKDPQVKAWATKTLPTIKGHLAMDEQLLKGKGMKSTM